MVGQIDRSITALEGDPFAGRLTTADGAIAVVQPGQHDLIPVGSNPSLLAEALALRFKAGAESEVRSAAEARPRWFDGAWESPIIIRE
jgi:hypothetical protein